MLLVQDGMLLLVVVEVEEMVELIHKVLMVDMVVQGMQVNMEAVAVPVLF